MNSSTVLIVEDDQTLREALSDTLEIAGYSVAAAGDGRAALTIVGERDVGMVVSDVQMRPMDGHTLLKHIKERRPDLPVMLMTAYGDIQKAVQAMRDGAVDYLVKPFEAEVLVNMVGRYIGPLTPEDGDFIAEDVRSREVKELAARVADSDVTVLISGESGTGKEVLARFIHEQSRRIKHAFVAINCAAIPANMLEATLFGYEKGAFTGAYNSCPGKFEQANGGTLLLDEISEMDLGLQAKLLRVLQEREVERLGGRKVIPLNVRVLATTNRILREEVEDGRFREDLYYRLNVFPIHLPPLRERVGDIVPLVRRLLERAAAASGQPIPAFSEAACARLLEYPWPGNVRELDNLIQRAVILRRGEIIEAEALRFESPRAAPRGAQPPAVEARGQDNLNGDLKSREQRIILEALEVAMGSRKQAAAKLGISQRTLRYKLARMRDAGLRIPGPIGAESA